MKRHLLFLVACLTLVTMEAQVRWGHYHGDRIGIYSYNDCTDEGWVDVAYLHFGSKQSIAL